MSREALVLLVCCCDFRDGAEWLIPSKSLRNAVIRAFPGLFRILRMCAPRRAAAVVRPRGREKSADRRRRILISRLLIIRTSVPRRKSPFPAYFKGFPAVSPLIPPYPAFLKYPVSPQSHKLPRSPIRQPAFSAHRHRIYLLRYIRWSNPSATALRCRCHGILRCHRFNNYRHLLIGGIINRRSKLHSPHLLSSIPQFLQKMKWQIESDAVRLFIPKTHRCKQRVRLPPYPLHTTNQ